MNSRLLTQIGLLVFAIFFSSQINAQQNGLLSSNEKILFNAKIFTADVQYPYAEAIAIRGDKIVAVGNFENIKKLVSKDAVLIDMHGGCILPGFIDSHSHSLDGGYSLMHANVYDSAITSAKLELYAEEVKKNETGMVGNFLVIDGINISTWSHIDELQNIFNNNEYTAQPVLLRGSDGHTAWVNKKILQLAGINKNFIDSISASQKKYFGVDKNGEPNGFFADSGFEKVSPILPKENIDWHESGIKAIQYNNAYGITAWLDPAAGDISDEKNNYLETYKQLSLEHKLTAHVATYRSF
jgi:predicted amidohydrolase YtcJ